MKSKQISLILTAILAVGFFFASCEDGRDGSDGNDGLNSYLVIFNGNGGTPYIDAVGILDGNSVSEPADPVHFYSSFEFTGWFTSKIGGQEWDFSAPITDNITLYAQWTVSSLTDLSDWLKAQPGGVSAEYPVNLTVKLSFGNMIDNDVATGNWLSLLEELDDAGKYVALDLSDSSISGDFVTGYNTETGKEYIVSLILPDTATTIMQGVSDSNPNFKNFINLKEIIGLGVMTIGQNAFFNCVLETISFPIVSNVGISAFGGDNNNLINVTISAGMTDVHFQGSHSNRMNAFRNYYLNAGNARAGTYTWNGTAWTGPVN